MMRLSYGDKNEPEARIAAVLIRERYPGHTELHIKRRDNNTYLLVCLAGSKGAHPVKLKAQGPFHSAEQAQAARNAIMYALKREGYRSTEDLPCWELHAQAFANNSRETLRQNQGDYSFDPKDVF